MDDSGYKGFNYPLKGIVTSLDDPANLNRIQVYIPNYHGRRDSSREGPGGSYPWAQVNTLIQQIEETTGGEVESSEETSSGGSGILGWISGVVTSFANKVKRIFTSDDNRGFENIAPPEVEDVVWLIFEGGDIRCPVYFGTAALPKNAKDKILVDLGSVNSYGESSYSADGSGGSTYQLAGGSLVDMAISILFCNGGTTRDYGKIISGDSNTSMALGYPECSARNGDAAKLLRNIYNKDQSTYKSLCNSNFGSFIDPNKNWSNQTLPASNRLTKAIKKILESVSGKDAQDETAAALINTYMSKATSAGVSDPTAILMFCHMYYKCGSSVFNGVRSLSGKSLDDLYEYSKTLSGYNSYYAYSAIQQYISQGKFIKKTTPTLSGGDSGISLKWPVPSSKTVITPFSTAHPGIDIKANAGVSVVAAHAGTVVTSTDNRSYGKYIVIQGSNGISTSYKHLQSIRTNGKQGSNVKAGEYIASVGMTGDATGYHLHFEVLQNNVPKDPQRFMYGGNATTSGPTIFNEAQIWNGIRSLGYSAVATAGLMGNIQAESALRSNNVQDGFGWDDNAYTNGVDSGTYTRFTSDSIGYGLCQWTWGPRKSNLLAYAKSQNKSIADSGMQLRFMHQELTSSYRGVYNTLMSTNSVDAASDVVLRDFESPKYLQYEYRRGLCRAIYNRYA